MDYNTSDKLAIALTCLTGIMAIALFLIEKTPTTVILLVILMLAFSVYPIFHFLKSTVWRVVAGIAFAAGIIVFGRSVWPHRPPVSGDSTAAPSRKQPDVARQPDLRPSLPIKTPKARPEKQTPHEKPAPRKPPPILPQTTPGTQICPNGICIGGDNSGNPSVTNFNGVYPPPGVVPQVTVCTSNSTTGDHYETVLKLNTDTPISEPAWWFAFDGPVDTISAEAEPSQAPFGYAYQHAPTAVAEFPAENIVGITVREISGSVQEPWRPNVAITVKIKSQGMVKLKHIESRSLNVALQENFIFKVCQSDQAASILRQIANCDYRSLNGGPALGRAGATSSVALKYLPS